MRADRTTLQRAGTLGAALAAAQLTLLNLANSAAAAPVPSAPASAVPSAGASPSSNCSGLVGFAQSLCQQKGGSSGGAGGAVTSSLDPVQALANSCATAAAWLVRKLSTEIDSTTQVDFTNAAFLRQYAVVFAASTFLTLLLWLLAVAKRAVRGVPLHQAFGEAIGFLWLTVLASAFTPLILYTVVSATDGITEAIALGTKSDTATYLGTFANTLAGGNIGGGPIIVIAVSLIAVLASAVVWIELLIRTAMLYVGALLGTVVYAGMVDKQLWKHVRRWAGVMIAVDLIKPVIVIVLGLAGAVASDAGANDAFSTVLAGLAILFLSIFASAAIYNFVPGFGDDMMAMRRHRAAAVSAGRAVVNGPANFMKQGISAHGGRAPQTGGGSSAGGARPGTAATGVQPGVAAHGTRTAGPPPQPPAPRGTGSGGQGGTSGTISNEQRQGR